MDIEGGYGGSSRSLFHSLKYIDRDRIDAEVWCKREGPILNAYRQIELPCKVFPEMPKVSSLPRFTRNLFAYGIAAKDFMLSKPFREHLLRAVKSRFDLVHFNHEGLFLLAIWLRKRCHIPFTMHIRTRPVNSVFARRQMALISAAIDHFVYITENEKKHFKYLRGKGDGSVVYNIVDRPPELPAPHPLIPNDKRFKIASLSNFSLERGTDRLADIAAALRNRDRFEFLFIVAGNMQLTKSLPGELGQTGRQGGTFVDHIKRLDLEDFFLFTGHVSQPERILTGCKVLVKAAHGNNPWGRDILEALAYGRPVLATGLYDKFVRNGITGYLHPDFDPEHFADNLIFLAESSKIMSAMSRNATAAIAKYCNGNDRAQDLMEVWHSVRRP